MRHKQHECNTSETQATRVGVSAILTTREQHETYKNEASVTRVKNFGFANNTTENIFSHPYISYIAIEILQVEQPF